MKGISSSLVYDDTDFVSIIFVLCFKPSRIKHNVVLLHNDGVYERSAIRYDALKIRVIK